MKPKLKIFIKLSLTFIVFFFIAKHIYINIDKINNYKLTFDNGYFALSILIMGVSMIFPIFMWRYLLNKLGPTEDRTRVSGFKVLSDNRYTMRPKNSPPLFRLMTFCH